MAFESESTLTDLGVTAGLLNSARPAQTLTGTAAADTLTGSDVGSGAALDNRIYGYGGNDVLNGGLGDDLLRGGTGADVITGGAGEDLLIGGQGADDLTGGTGVDVFRWEAGDQGTAAAPAADVIRDFSNAALAQGGDVLDLSSLLSGEGRIGNNPGNLANYLHFQQTPGGTIVHISPAGGFVGGFGSATAGAASQTILLAGVDLVGGMTSDAAVIADLLGRGKLVVDTLSANGGAASNTLTLGGQLVDGDGDTATASVSIDTAGVPTPGAPVVNGAPVVQLAAQNVLGLIGLGALGLNLNEQDVLAADADGNLARVELTYAPLVAVNLSPISFGYSAGMAAGFGLNVQVEQSAGVAGIVAPSARIVITSQDGGPLDNAEINAFLETVHLTDTGGGLLSSTLLSVNLLNALTVTATDTAGLSSSAVIGSLANVNALNSLDGPNPTPAPMMARAAETGPWILPGDPDVDGKTPSDDPLINGGPGDGSRGSIDELLSDLLEVDDGVIAGFGDDLARPLGVARDTMATDVDLGWSPQPPVLDDVYGAAHP